MRPVTHASLVSAAGGGGWSGGDGSIKHEFLYEHDHSLGWANGDFKCFPETAGDPPRISNEASLSFEVEDFEEPSNVGAGLFIGQRLKAEFAWTTRDGITEHEVQTWDEVFRMKGSVSEHDYHWDGRPFPKYCKMEMKLSAELFVGKFINHNPIEEGNLSTRTTGHYLYSASSQPVSEDGQPAGDPENIDERNGNPITASFQSDPNVERVGDYSGEYSYEQSIDHCDLVPLYDMIHDYVRSSGTELTVGEVWAGAFWNVLQKVTWSVMMASVDGFVSSERVRYGVDGSQGSDRHLESVLERGVGEVSVPDSMQNGGGSGVSVTLSGGE